MTSAFVMILQTNWWVKCNMGCGQPNEIGYYLLVSHVVCGVHWGFIIGNPACFLVIWSDAPVVTITNLPWCVQNLSESWTAADVLPLISGTVPTNGNMLKPACRCTKLALNLIWVILPQMYIQHRHGVQRHGILTEISGENLEKSESEQCTFVDSRDHSTYGYTQWKGIVICVRLCARLSL